jgi:peptidyl-prolyl cis-trans isomerase B (cyclophilin B)
MISKLNFILAACMMVTFQSQAQVKKTTPKSQQMPSMSQAHRVKIHTDMGDIIVKLYDETPLHRDNFMNLVKQGFYDSLLFHRIIPGFMIQGGDPTSKNADPGAMLGSGGSDMARIPAEFRPNLFHKKGALAAARDGNPEKASSACQFYLVQGKVYTNDELNMMEAQTGIKFSQAQRDAYKTVGGTPFLDQNYTVFGEIEKGLEIVDKIASSPRNSMDRPNEDVKFSIQLMN